MDIQAPEPRNYGQETRDTLQAQVDLAPDRYAAEAQFSPLYTDLGVSNAQRALLGGGDQAGLLSLLEQVQPKIAVLNAAGLATSREQDIADVERLGARATAAIRAADPRQERLLTQLNDQAAADLEAGYGLDPGLRDSITQNVRASQASRGFGFGSPDAVAEAFTLGERGVALRQQRRQNAMQVAGINASTAQDPFMAILGRPGTATTQSQALIGQGQGMSPGMLFNPESAYASDVNNTNYNANAAARIATGNANAALYGSAISAAGNMGSSL